MASKATLSKRPSVSKREQKDKKKSAKEASSTPAATESTTSHSQSSVSESAAGSDVVYVGRIPHGFYEEEMRAYFSQFGEILKLRLSRNKKTGASKHYAFIQFKDSEVAAIVAETMDQYLMFNRLLQCKLMAKDKIHPDLWRGANRTFKKLPRGLLARRKDNKTRTAQDNENRARRLLSREAQKRAKLAELSMDYEFPGYTGSVPDK